MKTEQREEAWIIKRDRLVIASLVVFVACLVVIFGLYLAADALNGWQSIKRGDFIFSPMLSIVSAFMATAFIVLIYEAFVRDYVDKDIGAIVRRTIQAVLFEKSNLDTHGILGVHENFRNELFETHVKDSKQVVILQTYAPNLPGLRSTLLAAMASGCHVRVALVKPASAFVDVRFPELKSTREEFVAGINASVETLRRFARQAGGGKLEIRLYDRAPGVSIYATDKVAFVGSFLSDLDSINSPQLEVQSESRLYTIYIEHFERLWNEGEVVKLELNKKE